MQGHNTVRDRFIRLPAGARKRIAEVTESFFTEVAVLLFVFPVLDEYVQYGQKAMTTTLLVGSLSASLACYLTAASIAAFINEEDQA